MNKKFLFQQILLNTTKELKTKGYPISTILSNYEKLNDNKAIYIASSKSKKIIDNADKIKNFLIKGNSVETITFIENDITKGIIGDYFISNVILGLVEYYTNIEYSVGTVAEYINAIHGINIIHGYSNTKLIIIDLRNIHMLPENEQEKFILNMFSYLAKRNTSKLNNIILINDGIKNIIDNNTTIHNLFKDTIIIK